MTNTVPNVSRELLERASNLAFQTQHYPLHEELRTLLSAPSPANHVEDVRAMVAAPSPAGVDEDDEYMPDGIVRGIMQSEEVDAVALAAKSLKAAGVDGLNRYEVFPYLDDDVAELDICEADDGSFVKYDAAQAIIDGLRGEVASQEETANQWRELALQFDRHRMTAMAHIRAAASGDKSAIEALGVFAALPPIPGHEITAARDQQAQRIGELEGLLRACHSALYPFDNNVLEREIDAALSAVCAAAPNIATTSEHSGS